MKSPTHAESVGKNIPDWEDSRFTREITQFSLFYVLRLEKSPFHAQPVADPLPKKAISAFTIEFILERSLTNAHL